MLENFKSEIEEFVGAPTMTDGMAKLVLINGG